jgi:hypothetical protein
LPLTGFYAEEPKQRFAQQALGFGLSAVAPLAIGSLNPPCLSVGENGLTADSDQRPSRCSAYDERCVPPSERSPANSPNAPKEQATMTSGNPFGEQGFKALVCSVHERRPRAFNDSDGTPLPHRCNQRFGGGGV